MVPGFVLAVVGAAFTLLDGSLPLAVGRLLFAVVLVPTAAGTALGIGALVPRFEQRTYMNVEQAHPSNFATLGFLLGGMFVGGIGFVLVGWTLGGATIGLAAAGWLTYLLVVVGTATAGYVYAVRKFDALTLDDL